MAVKEKCGVLAFIPNRIKSLTFDYLLEKDYINDTEKSDYILQLISRYALKVTKDDIILCYSFAESLKNLNHRGYDGYGYSLLANDKLITKVFISKVNVMQLASNILETLIKISEEFNFINPLISYLVGHVRYSTNDSYDILDNQPYQRKTKKKRSREIAICFNGNILVDESDFGENNAECKYMISQEDVCSDESELLVMSKEIKNNIRGAFSILLYDKDSICAFKDNSGIRPLLYLKSKNLYVITSESVAIKNIESFTLNQIASNELHDFQLNTNSRGEKLVDHCIVNYERETLENLCSFELIYFSNEKSVIKGEAIKKYREKLGKKLAKKEELNINESFIVGYIPQSAMPYALGYVDQLQLKLTSFIKKSGLYERSFIKNDAQIKSTLEKKFLIDKSFVKGKNIILIDDSIVRGNTISFISKQLRLAGAKEIHIRIASPKIIHECDLGVNTKSKELICKEKEEKKLCEELNIDSLIFLNETELIDVIGENTCRKCLNTYKINKKKA